MRKELEFDVLSLISGGNAYINEDTSRMCFTSFDQVYQFSAPADDVKAVCDSFIGEFATVEEFDAACRDALLAKGWITEI